MTDLSAHFVAAEFRCKGHGQKGHQSHPTCVADELVELLERIRHHAGDRPVKIVSGHRCAWWNKRQAGAPSSQHVLGNAADIPEGLVTGDAAVQLGARGVGTRGRWAVHVDVRQVPARWAY